MADQFVDPWNIPGWTSQNPIWIETPDQYDYVPFPKELVAVTVTGEFFTTTRRPLSGYLTFTPSVSSVTFTPEEGDTFSIRSRTTKAYLGGSANNSYNSGINYANLSYGNAGRLNVTLLATDNAGMVPSSFTYHVVEHFLGGTEYDIQVPKDSIDKVDISTLVIT